MTDKDAKKWWKYMDRLHKKKSIHELCKAFPNKTYAELEKYRNADRFEEAIGIGHNNPPEDNEEKHEV